MTEKINYSDHFEEFKPFGEKKQTYEPVPKEPLERITDALEELNGHFEKVVEFLSERE